MYKVVVKFADSADNQRIYNVGDEYPAPGAIVSEGRLEELSSNHNALGSPVIVNEEPHGTLSEATGDTEEAKADQHPPKKSEAKEKTGKKREKNA